MGSSRKVGSETVDPGVVQMAKSKSDPVHEFHERSRDLAELRRLADERGQAERDSPKWLELTKQEAALTRKIRGWVITRDELPSRGTQGD
jgi:Flp pilus assembly CpaE family ATPase